MDRLEEHRQRVAAFPDDVRKAHEHASYHRDEVLGSFKCGCFYCCKIFGPTEIKEWIDRGQTALCPKCGIDSVLGDRSGYEITENFLKKMYHYWFQFD